MWTSTPKTGKNSLPSRYGKYSTVDFKIIYIYKYMHVYIYKPIYKLLSHKWHDSKKVWDNIQ